LPLLERACLDRTAVKTFRDMLAEDVPPNGPRLPSLTKLVLVDVELTAVRTNDLMTVLVSRMQQGVPLDSLDLRMCVPDVRAIRLLRHIVVVEAQEPLSEQPGWTWDEGIGYCHEVEYDDENDDDDEDEDEAEYGDEYLYDD
jgi:hypothetical protein